MDDLENHRQSNSGIKTPNHLRTYGNGIRARFADLQKNDMQGFDISAGGKDTRGEERKH